MRGEGREKGREKGRGKGIEVRISVESFLDYLKRAPSLCLHSLQIGALEVLIKEGHDLRVELGAKGAERVRVAIGKDIYD